MSNSFSTYSTVVTFSNRTLVVLQLTWKYNANRDLPGIEEAWNILNGRGAGFFDTAEVYGYGLSETIIGTQLAKTPAVERANVIIATKVFICFLSISLVKTIRIKQS